MSLFKTIDEIKNFLPITVSFTFEDVLPFIKEVERDEIIPLISKEQYDDLNDEYNATTPSLSDAQTALLERIRYALAPLAFKRWIPFGQVQISSAGIRIASNDQIKTAFPWQIDKLEESALRSGFSALESLLQFMQDNKADYALWTASDSYTLFKKYFINSASDFSDFYNINKSVLVFKAVKANMKKVEDFFIKPVITTELFDEIKTQIKDDNLSEANETLMEFIQPAVANLTMAKALSEKSVSINEYGISVFAQTYTENPGKGNQPSGPDRIDALIRQADADGKAYLKQLQDYLNTNASETVYPLYFDSDNYYDPTETNDRPENKDTFGAILM